MKRPLMNSCCTCPYGVYNIELINFEDGIEFKETKDHSKWAITTTSAPNTVCVGDINRMESQRKRGGGAVTPTNTLPLISPRHASPHQPYGEV